MMATRADFYIQDSNGNLEFLGSTINDYDGDFEKANTVSEYKKLVLEKLTENNSELGRWYWPWKNSLITDEVFIFKNTPKFLNRDKGVLLTKAYHKGKDYNKDLLGFVPFKDRHSELQDNDGYFPESMLTFIEMPTLK